MHMDLVAESMINHIRNEERKKMIEEGYIHKDDCPRAREDKKIKELKKANKSLQRKVTELTLEIEAAKMMR